MTKKLRYFCTLLLMMVAGVTWAADVTDVMTAAKLKATNTTYTNFSGVTLTSDAVYAGNNAKDNSGNIQMRSNNSNSGIVTTSSGGKIKSIKITVGSGTKTIDVYGKNTAYESAEDLYDASKQGTKIGSVSETGTILVSDEYTYVGVRSNNGTIYLASIEFTWITSTTPTVSAPAFSPVGGTYTKAQTVTITSETPDATIYYTLDGNDPTTSSTLYTEPITISETKTLKAIAVKSDMNNSAVSTAEYTIITSTDGKVTDVMTAGDLVATTTSYKDFTGVTLTSDAVYAGNNANNNGNIQLRSSNSNSGIVTTTSGGKILTVKINVASGSNTVDVYGSNTAYASAADLYNASKQGTKLGSVSTTETISVSGDYKYVGVRANNGGVYLSSIEFTWNTSTAPTAAAPTFSPAGGTYTEAQSVTITSTTEDATIYYTLDGSTPSASSTPYTGPITISETATIKAIATKSGMNNSAVNSADYTILNVADAMTVAEGITYTQGVGTAGSTEPIMVKGVISQIEGLVGGTSITYWISDDGTTTNQMEVYKGKGLNGADFSAVTDLTVGDKVVVYGKVKMFSTTAEFDAGSILLSREENTDPYISAPDVVNLAYDATEGEIEVSIENAAIAILGGSIEEGCDWITDLNTSVSPVTFKTTVNESNEPREATITFTGGGASKVVTITQAGAPVVYTTIPDIFAAAKEIGTTATDVLVKFGGWVVTGVSTNGKNVFVSDGTNGFIIFGENLGLEVGSTLTSSNPISCKLKLYNGSAQVTGLTASTEGLTVGSGGSVGISEITMAKLAGENTGALVSYKELTCSVDNGKYYLSDGTTTLQVYNTLYAFGALEAGKKYNITGVYQQFNTTKEILPRSAADIKEVTSVSVEIGETGYATLYYGNLNLKIPEGVIATVVSDIEGTKLVEDEVTDIIPAGTGVILKGTPNTTYIFNVVSGTVTPVGSMTGGFDEDSKINGDPENIYYYKFSTKNGKVGFWWGAEDGGLFVSKAHKIFLAVPKSYFDTVSSAKNFISFFGEDNGVTTSINNVEKIAEGAAIYNLNGVRVNKMQKGVYVVNGKKVVIK